MSTYLCETDTFAKIYTSLQIFDDDSWPNTSKSIKALLECAKGINHGKTNDFAKAMIELFVLNVEAVNERYGEKLETIIDRETFNEICSVRHCANPYQFYKALECLHYQLSEGSIRQTELYGCLGNLIDSLCRDLVHKTNLYKEAEWG